MVTWVGTVFCDLSPSGGALNFRLDFQLRPDTEAPVINSLGGLSIGHSASGPSAQAYTEQTPLTVLRAFGIASAGSRTFRLMGKATFTSADASTTYCNVNGGQMSVMFIPR